MASRAIFIEAPICDFRLANAKSKSGSAFSHSEEPRQLAGVDRQYLAAFVISTGRAGGVRWNGAPALRALVELRRLPAMRRFASAQPHLRSFAFWDSHKSGSGKQGFEKKQGSCPD